MTQDNTKSADVCLKSGRTDGKLHTWKADGDDPYLVCHWCGEVRDAITGRIIKPAAAPQPLVPAPASLVEREAIEQVAKITARYVGNQFIREHNDQYWHMVGSLKDLVLAAQHQALVLTVDAGELERVDLELNGEPHWFSISRYQSQSQLHIALHGNGIYDYPSDTIAYTDTWSLKESIVNGLGDRNCAGHIYLLADADIDTLAHEATHMALGILSRHGKRSLPVVTTKASQVEEDLCALVGFICDQLIGSTLRPNGKEGQ